MALINRISQLFRADINAVLDHIEEPEQLLKQAVRDMEDELASCEQRIAACAREQESLAARMREAQSSAPELDEQLDLCFESGKEGLARNIIRRKLETGRIVRHLNTRMEANERFLEKERRQLKENLATLESLRQKAELFVCRTPSAEPGFGNEEFARLSQELRVTEDEVEIALLREKTARSLK